MDSSNGAPVGTNVLQLLFFFLLQQNILQRELEEWKVYFGSWLQDTVHHREDVMVAGV